MARATLTLTIPDGIWIGDLSRHHPAAFFQVLAAMPGETSGFGLVEISGPEVEAVVAGMADAEAVADLTVLRAGTETALVQFETDDHAILTPIRKSGVPIEMPITIGDGEAVIDVTAPRPRLSALADALSAHGIDYSVDRIHGTEASSQSLTDRQWTLVRAAVEAGYYDTPRGCSLTELADDLDLAKSTCSETLHRAEGRIVKRYVDEHSEFLG